jgi:glutathione synthase/RimK-type ligase-like ATP-grasp enzyme
LSAISGREIALATGRTMRRPDPESHLLVAALERLGVGARLLIWDEELDWGRFPLVVVRTPWDYFSRLEDFLDWAERVGATTSLWNPFEVLRWNHHKAYLLELAEHGVPTLPTTLLRKGAGPAEIEAALAHGGELIVKPAVSVGAIGLARLASSSAGAVESLQQQSQEGDLLVQPFEPGVLHGERSLVFLGGAYSHAVRKIPAAGDFRVHEFYGGRVELHTPSDAELAVAALTLRAVGHELAYARVDLVDTVEGPKVMELELIEPELFFSYVPSAADRFAAHLISLL